MSRFTLLLCALGAAGLAAQPAYASANKPGREMVHDKRPVRLHVVRPPILQDYAPDPAIWLLQDDDTRIYLFGTIHLLPEGFRWRNPRLDAIVAEAEELIVETTDEEIEAEQIATLLGSFESREPVSTRMSPENGEKWRSIARLVEMEPDDFDRIPPILAVFGMSMAHYDLATGADEEFGVETLFEADFRAAGKPVGSIEKASDVLSSLLAIDEGILIAQLERDLADWDGGDVDGWLVTPTGPEVEPPEPLADEHKWAKGGEIDLEAEMDDGSEVAGLLVKVLLDDRNRAWADWLKARLDRPGDVLVAVGAAHLAGQSSVQNHLSERGLTVERVNPQH